MFAWDSTLNWYVVLHIYIVNTFILNFLYIRFFLSSGTINNSFVFFYKLKYEFLVINLPIAGLDEFSLASPFLQLLFEQFANGIPQKLPSYKIDLSRNVNVLNKAFNSDS